MLLPPLKPVPFPSSPFPASLCITAEYHYSPNKTFSAKIFFPTSWLVEPASLFARMHAADDIDSDWFVSLHTRKNVNIPWNTAAVGKVGRLMRSRLAATFYLNLSRLPYPCASHFFSFLPINIFFITSAQHLYTFCLYLFTAIGVLCWDHNNCALTTTLWQSSRIYKQAPQVKREKKNSHSRDEMWSRDNQSFGDKR